MLEHPVFSSEVNDGSQKGRSVLYVLYVCSSPFSLAMYTYHIILQIAFSKLTKKFAKSKECKKQNIYDQKVIFQNIRENELVIPHAIKVYRVCI